MPGGAHLIGLVDPSGGCQTTSHSPYIYGWSHSVRAVLWIFRTRFPLEPSSRSGKKKLAWYRLWLQQLWRSRLADTAALRSPPDEVCMTKVVCRTLLVACLGL